MINGSKDTNYYSELDQHYLSDIRWLKDPVTRIAVDYHMKRTTKLDFVSTLEQVAQLQMLVGDKISASLPQITIEEALSFLQYDQSQLVEMQRVLAPRFSSSLTRSFLIQQF